MTWKLCWNK